MTARQLLDCAGRLMDGPDEADWRSAASRGYYAAFHATVALFRSLRFRVPPDGSAHVYLTDRLQNAQIGTWVSAGTRLFDLRRARNTADYDLTVSLGEAWAETIFERVNEYFDLIDELRGDPDLLEAVQAIRAYEQARGAVTYVGPG